MATTNTSDHFGSFHYSWTGINDSSDNSASSGSSSSNCDKTINLFENNGKTSTNEHSSINACDSDATMIDNFHTPKRKCASEAELRIKAISRELKQRPVTSSRGRQDQRRRWKINYVPSAKKDDSGKWIDYNKLCTEEDYFFDPDIKTEPPRERKRKGGKRNNFSRKKKRYDKLRMAQLVRKAQLGAAGADAAVNVVLGEPVAVTAMILCGAAEDVQHDPDQLSSWDGNKEQQEHQLEYYGGEEGNCIWEEPATPSDLSEHSSNLCSQSQQGPMDGGDEGSLSSEEQLPSIELSSVRHSPAGHSSVVHSSLRHSSAESSAADQLEQHMSSSSGSGDRVNGMAANTGTVKTELLEETEEEVEDLDSLPYASLRDILEEFVCVAQAESAILQLATDYVATTDAALETLVFQHCEEVTESADAFAPAATASSDEKEVAADPEPVGAEQLVESSSRTNSAATLRIPKKRRLSAIGPEQQKQQEQQEQQEPQQGITVMEFDVVLSSSQRPEEYQQVAELGGYQGSVFTSESIFSSCSAEGRGLTGRVLTGADITMSPYMLQDMPMGDKQQEHQHELEEQQEEQEQGLQTAVPLQLHEEHSSPHKAPSAPDPLQPDNSAELFSRPSEVSPATLIETADLLQTTSANNNSSGTASTTVGDIDSTGSSERRTAAAPSRGAMGSPPPQVTFIHQCSHVTHSSASVQSSPCHRADNTTQTEQLQEYAQVESLSEPLSPRSRAAVSSAAHSETTPAAAAVPAAAQTMQGASTLQEHMFNAAMSRLASFVQFVLRVVCEEDSSLPKVKSINNL